jgi:Ran GTPase-activating protein (RanGAP) involved in mRNA processing and transport
MNNLAGRGKSFNVIAEGLAFNTTLREFDVSGCWLGNSGVRAIAAKLQRRKQPLGTLALCDNNIDAIGVRCLFDVLGKGNVYIQDLVLNINLVGDDGAACLADALRRNLVPSLKRLFLDQTNIGDDGLVALSSALVTNSSLELLSMERNDFGERGLLALANSLPRIKELRRIDLSWDNNVAAAMPKLLQGFIANKSLTFVHLPGFEHGDWVETMLYLRARNCFTRLLKAPESAAPLGLWPRAIVTATEKPATESVIFHILRERVDLIGSATTTQSAKKRKRTEAGT